MPFDPATFEAEVSLKLIPTERLPLVAQDALEAGFDGPRVIRMAILEPNAGWAINQALKPMLEELGCNLIPLEQAALRLARQRAQRILDSGENPLVSSSYFYRLLVAADYPEELLQVGYFDDYDVFHYEDVEEERTRAREALQELLSPELHQRRKHERKIAWHNSKIAWEQQQAMAKAKRDHGIAATSRQGTLKQRYFAKMTELRPIVWTVLVAWLLVGLVFNSWRTTVVGYVVSMPMLCSLPLWGEYLQMRRERRAPSRR